MNSLTNIAADSITASASSATSAWFPPTGISSITSTPYYSVSSTGFATTDFGSSYVNETLDTMPLILEVTSVRESMKKIEISFTKFSHKNHTKFLPDNGTVLIYGPELYGVYDSSDYYYWENCLAIEVEDLKKALESIKVGNLFTTINNFDEHITNEEVCLFLHNYKNYCRYAHKYLESLLVKSSIESKGRRLDLHQELDNQL